MAVFLQVGVAQGSLHTCQPGSTLPEPASLNMVTSGETWSPELLQLCMAPLERKKNTQEEWKK